MPSIRLVLIDAIGPEAVSSSPLPQHTTRSCDYRTPTPRTPPHPGRLASPRIDRASSATLTLRIPRAFLDGRAAVGGEGGEGRNTRRAGRVTRGRDRSEVVSPSPPALLFAFFVACVERRRCAQAMVQSIHLKLSASAGDGDGRDLQGMGGKRNAGGDSGGGGSAGGDAGAGGRDDARVVELTKLLINVHVMSTQVTTREPTVSQLPIPWC